VKQQTCYIDIAVPLIKSAIRIFGEDSHAKDKGYVASKRSLNTCNRFNFHDNNKVIEEAKYRIIPMTTAK
jgi:hypothetical protein